MRVLEYNCWNSSNLLSLGRVRACY